MIERSCIEAEGVCLSALGAFQQLFRLVHLVTVIDKHQLEKMEATHGEFDTASSTVNVGQGSAFRLVVPPL